MDTTRLPDDEQVIVVYIENAKKQGRWVDFSQDDILTLLTTIATLREKLAVAVQQAKSAEYNFAVEHTALHQAEAELARAESDRDVMEARHNKMALSLCDQDDENADLQVKLARAERVAGFLKEALVQRIYSTSPYIENKTGGPIKDGLREYMNLMEVEALEAYGKQALIDADPTGGA